MMNQPDLRPRSHNELAALMILHDASNLTDELHDRNLDDLADAAADALDSIIALATAIHDSRYARMTTRYDDTIPMTDDDADELSYELPDACDDADCCHAAQNMILAIYHAADYND